MSEHTHSFNTTVFFISCVGALGGLLFGFDTGVISGALLFIHHNFHSSTITNEMIVSSVVLGALVGALLSSRIADKFGRRLALLVVSVAFIIGTLLSVFAGNVTELIVGRFIVGMAIGTSSYITPLFIAEMAPSGLRGSFVLINAITITAGEALAFLSDYFIASSHNWRLMFAIGLIPATALFVGMLCLPESPRWLLLNGQDNRAKKILQRLRQRHDVNEEFSRIKQNIGTSNAQWRSLFSRKYVPVLTIAIALGVFQQFFGINTIMYYGPVIFKAAGFHTNSAALLATFGMGVVNMIMSAVCLLVIDRIGRRTLLLLGSAIAAVSLLTLSMTFAYHAPLITLISMISFIIGYCISVGSLFWLMIAEIFPLSVRAMGMSVATAIQWGANFVVSMSFLTILTTFGANATFAIYAGVCVACFIFCYRQVPETKGVPLEAIEQHLASEAPFRQLDAMLPTTK